jgi:amino acid transporter
MEMAGFHARETRDPGRTVPRAIALAVAITVLFSVLGSLFMAFVLPQKEISLVSGTMELFASVLRTFSLGWLLVPLALVVALGGVAHLTPWILGPAKGVAAVAQQGLAPAAFGRTNRDDVPVPLLVAQGVGGSVFALLFLLVPSVSTSYWMLSAVTAQVIVVMYALVFAAVIRLRYTQPATPRPYRIPGGLPGVAGRRGGAARLPGLLRARVRPAEPAQDRRPRGVRAAAGAGDGGAVAAAVRPRPPRAPAAGARGRAGPGGLTARLSPRRPPPGRRRARRSGPARPWPPP